MVQQHTSFEHFRPGVYLCTQYPYLAAMPDAMVKCKCCGEGVAEVKCPYTLASSVASNDPNFCLENWHRNQTLKRTHPYNFQVQAQMAVCNVAYCDFVVWTPLSMHIERVLGDEAFFDSVVPAAKKFFTHVIMPELFAAYFTRKATTNKCADNA